MRRHRFAAPLALALVACTTMSCSRSDRPTPTPAERTAHKAAIAAAAQDRMVLQYLVKDAELVNARLPGFRRVSAGYLAGDTSVIWFAFFAGDTLIVLDETRRGPPGVEENARYFFRAATLHYVVLDRIRTAGEPTPVRMRLAFGYDSVGVLSATSKNVNDAAQPLDTLADVSVIAARAKALRTRVLKSVTTAGAHPR